MERKTKEYNEIVSRNQSYSTKDMYELLNKDEEFYKSVCQKYLNTMTKEMILEIDNKILHFYIDDEYTDLNTKSRINETNYKEYLDKNFEVEEYNFYHELYYEVIKDNIAYDLNDLSLFDDTDFYKAKFAGVSDTQLYRQAGNSIVVNVLEFLLEQLLEDEINNNTCDWVA